MGDHVTWIRLFVLRGGGGGGGGGQQMCAYYCTVILPLPGTRLIKILALAVAMFVSCCSCFLLTSFDAHVCG